MTRSDIILEKGLSAQCTAVADETNSAARMGSGDLPVFATAVMAACSMSATIEGVANMADL